MYLGTYVKYFRKTMLIFRFKCNLTQSIISIIYIFNNIILAFYEFTI